jgi:hypothetical protein
VTATTQTSNGTVAVIEEKDNCLAQPDVDTIGGADVATGSSGQEGVPADKLTESLQPRPETSEDAG